MSVLTCIVSSPASLKDMTLMRGQMDFILVIAFQFVNPFLPMGGAFLSRYVVILEALTRQMIGATNETHSSTTHV